MANSICKECNGDWMVCDHGPNADWRPRTLEVLRDHYGRFSSIRYEGPHRNAWIGTTGMGFGNGLVGYNAHWHDLRRPWQRYSGGPTRFVFFWQQLWRGLRAFVDTRRGYDGEY
jgi:hypothetical protein